MCDRGGGALVFVPVFGAAVLHLVKDAVMPLTDFWRAILGAVIILLVLLFPQGLAGHASELYARLRGRPA